MAGARFWRVFALDTRGADLELSACHLYESKNQDPFFSNVSLQLEFEGAAITDTGPLKLTVAKSGSVQNSTAQYKHGTSAGFFDGAAQSFASIASNTAFGFGTGDFTIEAWIYIPSGISGSYAALCDTRSAASGAGAVLFKLNSARQLGYYGAGEVNSSAAVPLSTWTHVALCRASGVSRLFMDGQIVATTADGDNKAKNPCYIGRVYDSAHPAFSGYIDDLRITNGVARYTAAFTPPGAYEKSTPVRSDQAAAVSSAFPPVVGSLASLQDAAPVAVCRWGAQQVKAPGFYLQWDLGQSVANIDSVRLGGADSARWPDTLALAYSADGVQWTAAGDRGRFRWPGIYALTDIDDFLPLRPQMCLTRQRALTGEAPPPQGLQVTNITSMARALDTEFGGSGRIYGTVARKSTPANEPLKRRVRLHRSVDGLLVRETWSRPDGSYEFAEISSRYEYDVIAWDHEFRDFSTVANNQLAEPMP